MDRQWDWPHVASACTEAGESLQYFISHTYKSKLGQQSITEYVITIFVPLMQNAGSDEVQNSKYNLSTASTNT